MTSMRLHLFVGTFVFALALTFLVTVDAAAASRGHAAATLTAHGSAEQVYVLGLAPSERMSLVNAGGRTIATQPADSLGGLLFRNVPPGSGYRVRAPNGAESDPVTVHATNPTPWDPAVYNQTIPDGGYTYLTTRDGTRLAIDVHPPSQPAGVPGSLGPVGAPGQVNVGPVHVPLPSNLFTGPPWPTLIEYSGYGYANPAGPQSGIAILAASRSSNPATRSSGTEAPLVTPMVVTPSSQAGSTREASSTR